MEIRLDPPAWATHLLSDLHDWSRAPLPVADLRPFDLPDDVYFEYAWLDAEGKPRPDPANEDRRNPWWPHACAVAGPDYRADPWAAKATDRPRGRTRRLWMESADGSRRHRVLVHAPDGDFDAPRPTVYLQDGKAYFGWGRAARIAELLQEAGEIPPARYVFIQPVDRGFDYFFNERYRDFLAGELIPAIENRAPCAGRRVAMGASLGGLCSAWLALQRSDLFGAVVSQSGAFLMGPADDPPDPFGGSEWLLDQLRSGAGADLRWSLDCGTLEWLHPAHLRLAEALADGGFEHRAVSRHAGHNWVCWRDGLAGALRFALGGPATLDSQRAES